MVISEGFHRKMHYIHFLKGATCGRAICGFGEECCMTCDENGQSVESGECQSRINGNPGCPMVDCLPVGKFLYLHFSSKINQAIIRQINDNYSNIFLSYSYQSPYGKK